MKKITLRILQAKYTPIILVFCLAFLVRIAYNLTIARDYIPTFDAALYNTLGRNLVRFHCYCLYPAVPNVSRPPLWPFIIAAIYTFTGSQVFYVRLFYCVLGSGTCVLVYLFARQLFGESIALKTGIIAAVYTGLFIWDGWLYTESLFDFCLTAFTYSLYRLQSTTPPQRNSRPGAPLTAFQSWRQSLYAGRWAILCGILIGLLSLARPNGPILLGLLCLWVVIVAYKKILPLRFALRNALLIACLSILILAPWTYRNYTVTGRFIPVSTGLGEVLKGAYNDVAITGRISVIGMWRPPPHTGSPFTHDDIRYTPQSDALDTQAALTWMRAHPLHVPYLFLLHFANTWIPYDYAHGLPMEQHRARPSSTILLVLIFLMSIPIFITSVLGLVLTWKQQKRNLLPIYLVLTFIMAQNIIFYSDMRFRAPLEPFFVILTGGALWWFQARKANRRQPGHVVSTPPLTQGRGVSAQKD